MLLHTLYAELERSGRSPRVRQLVHVVLRLALKKAVGLELITTNPVHSVNRPKVQRKKMDVWSLDETKRFLAAVQGHPSRPLYHLALNTGMRQGELLALQWDDVDFKAKSVSVQHSLDRGKQVRS